VRNGLRSRNHQSSQVEKEKLRAHRDSFPGSRGVGIVRFALRFPHTFYVMAIAILFIAICAVAALGVLIWRIIKAHEAVRALEKIDRDEE
jgi:hypothetical protein